MGHFTRAKVVIIGSGPAGYTAAIYAARAMLEPILIQGIQPGGQLTITTDVENYPGFAEVIQCPWLMEQMRKQAEHVGTRLIADHVTRVDLGRRPFLLDCDSGARYRVSFRDGRGELVVRQTDDPTTLLHELTGEALARGDRLDDLTVTRPSLEDVYLELTADG